MKTNPAVIENSTEIKKGRKVIQCTRETMNSKHTQICDPCILMGEGVEDDPQKRINFLFGCV